MKNLTTAFIFFLLLFESTCNAQLNLQFVAEDHYPNFTIPIFNIESGYSALTPLGDRQGRPYVYVCSNELGLRIYETEPVLNLVATLDTAELTSKASFLDQSGDLLVVGLGDSFGDTLGPMRVATVDVSVPANPQVLDVWVDPSPTPNIASGVGSVRIAGNLCYIGGMGEGMVILDISNPNSIGFVSKIKPSIAWPHVNNTLANVNARGLALKDSLVYLCYDAGGMRTINVADPFNPFEVDSFANPVTFAQGNMPRAYNHVVIDDTVAYIASDYCGVEVWGLGNPLAPVLLHHWNPSGCPGGGLAWYGSPVHTNELKLLPECSWLFVATAKSEMIVFDIADPYNPIEIDSFGTVLDTTATWGIDLDDDRIYLTYVYVPDLPIYPEPFLSYWNGVKQLSYEHCNLSQGNLNDAEEILVFPNPMKTSCVVQAKGQTFTYKLLDGTGKECRTGIATNEVELPIDQLQNGLYVVLINNGNRTYSLKLVKAD